MVVPSPPAAVKPPERGQERMADREDHPPHRRWAEVRFSIIGSLLASPPDGGGELRERLRELAEREWKHPTHDERVRFGFSTIERWYYQALHNPGDPVGSLLRKQRRDAGCQPSLSDAFRRELELQYRAHRRWSYQLHSDNMRVRVKNESSVGPMPSYSSIRRYMVLHGLQRIKERGGGNPAEKAAPSKEGREVRSFEAAYTHAIWHLDFHHGKRKVITSEGRWVQPYLLGILDDRSRLACHVQWYLAESAENLIHGLCQAFQKRGLPRSLLTDNGSAMIAAETEEGLLRLGVHHTTTLPESPYQNGKQEVFWNQVEGRLMAMLEGVPDPSLRLLNEATQAWVEMEYNRAVNSETGVSPFERLSDGRDVSRICPGSDTLRMAFTMERSRAHRRSDGTVSIEGTRFEVPSRYRHLQRVSVRYARWDLKRVWLVDSRGTVLCPIYPLDRERNGDGRRRKLEPTPEPEAAPAEAGIAPLLKELMKEYASTGLPPAYVPKDETKEKE